MFERQNLLNAIVEKLSSIPGKISLNNSAGQFDSNTNAEWFYKDLLNSTYRLNLINMNTINNNYPAIDLGDTAAKWCFQVTSNATSQKITSTKNNFFEKGLNKQYKHLTFLVISNARYPTKTEIINEVTVDTINTNTVISEISKKDIDDLNKINEILDKHLSAPRPVSQGYWAGLTNIQATNTGETPYPQSFIRHLKFEKDEEASELLLNDLQKLKDELNKLDNSQRRALANLVIRASEKKELHFLRANELVITPGQHQDPDVNQLILAGLITVNSDHFYQDQGMPGTLLEIHFSKELDDTNILLEIKRFVENNPSQIERILSDRDFTVLQ